MINSLNKNSDGISACNRPLCIVVIGGSGDLARKKIFPALFALYCQGFLPDPFVVFSFARSDYSDSAFREKIASNLTCRYVPTESCDKKMRDFLDHCFYVKGNYGSVESILDLYGEIKRRFI